MACHAGREPAAEPETVFEPVVDDAAGDTSDSARRGVNLASHTGVGVAGAAGVLGAQRVLGSEEAPADGGRALDVFHPVVDASPDDQSRGISTNASPVAEQAEQGGLPGSAEGIDPPDETASLVPTNVLTNVEPVKFLPIAEAQAPSTEPEDVATAYQEADLVPAAESVEPERGSSLASAQTEIGGGISVDFNSGDPHSAFGASSEIGMLDTEELTAEDDDEDDLASTP